MGVFYLGLFCFDNPAFERAGIDHSGQGLGRGNQQLSLRFLVGYDAVMSSFERCVVLVADDEPAVLRLASHTLTRHGYIVIEAADGPSALRVCQKRDGPVHLALLDVLMPGMTGPELFERLRLSYPQLEALFMSGYRPEQIMRMEPSIDNARFIAKPFYPRDLVQRINDILGNVEVCVLSDETLIPANA